jgi:hypothetical protein
MRTVAGHPLEAMYFTVKPSAMLKVFPEGGRPHQHPERFKRSGERDLRGWVSAADGLLTWNTDPVVGCCPFVA